MRWWFSMKIEKNYIKISSLILIKTPVKNISYIPVWMLFQVIPPRAVHCPVRRTRGTGRGVCANGGCVWNWRGKEWREKGKGIT